MKKKILIKYVVPLLAVGMVQLVSAEEYEYDAAKIPPVSSKQVDFVKDIQPLIEKSCIGCHSGRRPKSKYSMETREKTIAGGSSKVKSIVDKKSDKSPLIHFMADSTKDEELWMPVVDKRDKYPKLTPEQIGLFRAWIDQGAKWPEGLVLQEKE
jgi:hypothetical protein